MEGRRETGTRVTGRMKQPDSQGRGWILAQKRHHLSHVQAQMARELGMNPARLGSLDNNKQEPWKLPLPQYIEELYLKRFGRQAPGS